MTGSPKPTSRISVIIPACNESDALRRLLPKVHAVLPLAEVVVVDDGSTDTTAEVAAELGAKVVCHPYNIGNGAAIKSGVRAATGDLLVFLDGDGQHDPQDIPRLLAVADRYDMVVGARSPGSHAGTPRRLANVLYNWFASYVTGQRISDLTSGFRVVGAEQFRELLHLLPNGFSYPTTSTMAFFRSGYAIGYVAINAGRRTGRSHIRPLHDGLKFLMIIFKIGTLYAPLKLFLPVCAAFFVLGSCNYLYTYLAQGRFTDMSVLMFTTSVLTFLIGLVSEQITQLVYSRNPGDPANQEVRALNAGSMEPEEDWGEVDGRRHFNLERALD